MFNIRDRIARLQAKFNRGEEARKILENPLFIHAMEEMERDIVLAMKRLNAGDEKGRDTLWRELRALTRMRGKFTQYVNSGESAAKELFKESQ